MSMAATARAAASFLPRFPKITQNQQKPPKQMFEAATFKNRQELQAYVQHIMDSGGFLAYHTIHVYPDNTLFVTLVWE